MGTYLLRAQTVGSGNDGTWRNSGIGQSDALLTAAIFDPSTLNYDRNINVGAIDKILRFTTKYYLDGSATLTELNDLPPGFHLLTARVHTEINLFDFGDLGSILFDPTRESPTFTATGHHYYDYPDDVLALLPVDLLADGMGLRYQSPDPSANNSKWYVLEIEGDYDIISSSYTFDINTPEPINIGTTVELTSNNIPPVEPPTSPDVGGLLGVEEVQLKYTDGNDVEQTITILTMDFIIWLSFRLIFIIPDDFDIFQGQIDIWIVGDGVIFSGSVLVGTLTLLLASASGIYRIDPNAGADTLYNRTVDGTTIDVKIPNPFVKTGFIGG